MDLSHGWCHTMGMLRISEDFSVPFQAASPLGLSHTNCQLGTQGLLQLKWYLGLMKFCSGSWVPETCLLWISIDDLWFWSRILTPDSSFQKRVDIRWRYVSNRDLHMDFFWLPTDPCIEHYSSAHWHHLRQRRFEAEEAADEKSHRFEEQEAENLRRESEYFLAQQMDEMQALAEEQCKAGLLLDDGAPVRLNVLIAGPTMKESQPSGSKEKAAVFTQDNEEEDGIKKQRVPLVKLDFSMAESGEQTRERLERIRQSVPHNKETLFKAKVRWDGLTDVRVLLPRHCTAC